MTHRLDRVFASESGKDNSPFPNTAPTVPAYLTKDGGAVYVIEEAPLRGIRFVSVRCYSPDGEEYAFFPSISEGTLHQTAKLLDWVENEKAHVEHPFALDAAQNPGSRAAYLGAMERLELTSDENGWELILHADDGNVYRANIHAAAEGLLGQMGQVQDWLAGA